MKVSIVMPAYNAARTIMGAINSIVSQTHKDWQLIIVNDGSTDGTADVYRKVHTDKRIKMITTAHLGIAAARNLGCGTANTEIIFTQDADDFSMPDRIEKVLNVFQKTDADIVSHSFYLNVWNEQYGCMERQYRRVEYADSKRIVEAQYMNGYPAFKKNVWQKKPFREATRYAYDWMMWCDWILSGFKVATIDEGLYEYVRYFGSASDRFEKDGTRANAFKIIREIVKEEYGIN